MTSDTEFHPTDDTDRPRSAGDIKAPVATGSPQLAPVPFDREIAPVLEAIAGAGPANLTPEALTASRAGNLGPAFPSAAEVVSGRRVSAEERTVPGPAGAPDLEITIFRPSDSDSEEAFDPAVAQSPTGRGIIVNFHGGGMIVGHRSWEHGRVVDLVEKHGLIGVNVEYRLAPEHPYPAGAEDNYAATAWVSEHAAELGGDPEKLIVMGGSAGGGFAAAISLMARDRKGPAIAGQMLLCPMLDNTNASVSARQFDGIGTWQLESNLFAWSCVLGEDLAYSEAAPPYAAPAHAQDLSGLPPTFIEVGAAEMFRDEDCEFAQRIWAVGGDAELHVWAGACHGFDMYAPDTTVTSAALNSRDSWFERVLA